MCFRSSAIDLNVASLRDFPARIENQTSTQEERLKSSIRVIGQLSIGFIQRRWCHSLAARPIASAGGVVKLLEPVEAVAAIAPSILQAWLGIAAVLCNLN